jgi:hypothetical protein
MKASSKKQGYRGDADETLEIVSHQAFVKTYKFNFLNEFTTEESPLSILNALEEFKAECNPELELIPNLDKKWILIKDKSRSDLTLKLKLFKAGNEDEESERLKLRFIKKAGTMQEQYELMEAMTPFIWSVCIQDEDEEG